VQNVARFDAQLVQRPALSSFIQLEDSALPDEALQRHRNTSHRRQRFLQRLQGGLRR
jgi:hypothetical protein